MNALKAVRKFFLAIALALLTFMTLLVFSTQPFEPIKQLYVFGDSLSDVGTVFQSTGGLYPPNPPYFQGRYSNGEVWVEYLANRLQLSPAQTNNTAWGGATTGSNGNHQSGNLSSSSLVPSLLTQVQSYVQTHQQAYSSTLFVLWAGANDYLQGENQVAIPVANLTQAITALVNVGAKRILVANLPDLGQLPATRTSPSSASLTALTQAHNQGLRRSLKQLGQRYSDLQIATLDANTLYRKAITNPPEFGFANVTSGCLSGSRACDNPNQFLFWDSIHPTTAAHRILADQAFSALESGRLTASP